MTGHERDDEDAPTVADPDRAGGAGSAGVGVVGDEPRDVDPTSPIYDPDQYGGDPWELLDGVPLRDLVTEEELEAHRPAGEMVPPVHGQGDRSTPHTPNRGVQGSNISSRPGVGSHVVVAQAPPDDQGAGTGNPGALDFYTCPDHVATGGYESCCECGGWTDDDPNRGRFCTEARP